MITVSRLAGGGGGPLELVEGRTRTRRSGCRRRRTRCAGAARSGPRRSSAGAWWSTRWSGTGCWTLRPPAAAPTWSSPPPRSWAVEPGPRRVVGGGGDQGEMSAGIAPDGPHAGIAELCEQIRGALAGWAPLLLGVRVHGTVFGTAELARLRAVVADATEVCPVTVRPRGPNCTRQPTGRLRPPTGGVGGTAWPNRRSPAVRDAHWSAARGRGRAAAGRLGRGQGLAVLPDRERSRRTSRVWPRRALYRPAATKIRKCGSQAPVWPGWLTSSRWRVLAQRWSAGLSHPGGWREVCCPFGRPPRTVQVPDQLHRLLELTGALPLFGVRDDSAQAGCLHRGRGGAGPRW